MAAVAVIVPCHDNAAHVGAAIASILAQSRAPNAVIVVDDGSTDASVEVVRGFGDAVRLVRQPNRGAAAARNAGIAASTAPLLAFLDADDAWPADSLEVRLAALGDDIDLVYGGIRQCLGGAGPDVPALGPAMPGRLAGALLVRRAVFARVGGFDEALSTAETIDWVARATEHGVRAAGVAATVLYRRIHAANLMRGNPAADSNALRVLRGAVRRRQAVPC